MRDNNPKSMTYAMFHEDHRKTLPQSKIRQETHRTPNRQYQKKLLCYIIVKILSKHDLKKTFKNDPFEK